MNERDRGLFDKIRNCVENSLYSAMFCVWRDEDYKVNYENVDSALQELICLAEKARETIKEELK